MRLPRPRTLRSRLFRILALAIGGVVAIVAALWFLSIQPALRQGVAEGQREAAERAADQIGDFIRNRIGELRAATEIGRFWELQRDRQRETLYRLLKLTPTVREISLADADGREVHRVSRTSLFADRDLTSVETKEWFLRGMRGEVYYGPVLHDRMEEPFMTVAVPARSTVADNRGVLAATVSLKTLWDAIAHIQIGRSGHAFVVDDQGTLIAHRDPSRVLLGRNVAPLPKVREFLASPMRDPSFGRAIRGEAGGKVISTYAPVPVPGWGVIVEEPVGTALAEIHRLGVLALVLILGAGAGAFAVSYVHSERIARPLDRLAAGATRLAQGDLEHRLEVRTGDEIEVLARQFNHMADQLHASHRELERKVAETTRDLSALYAVTGPIGQTNDLGAVMDDAVAKILTVTGADGASVRLLDATGTGVTVATYRGFPEAYVQAQAPIGQFNRMGREVLQSGQPVIVTHLVGDPVYGHGPLVRNGYRSAACLPLGTSGAPLGVMTLAARQPGQITPGQRELFVAIAHQIAVAIENARLFQGEQERRRQLEAVRVVTEEIARELDLTKLLELIHRRAIELVGGSRGVMWIWNGEEQVLVPKAWYGHGDSFSDARVRLGEGCTGMVAQQRAGMIVNDYQAWAHANPLFRDQAGVLAVLSEPLLYRDRLVGVISVESHEEDRPFTDQHRQTLALFAAEAAIAIENARLYEQAAVHAQTLEQRVRERTAELEAASRAKSEFLANMSHELRTPLNAIIGFADLLKLQTFGPLTPKQERYVQNIQTGGVHLLNLVNDLLDLARIEAGRLELQPEPTSLAAAAVEALDTIRPMARQKGLVVASALDPDLPAVFADPLRLRQVLTNLLSNAAKFTGAGGRVMVRARRLAAGETDRPGPGDLVELQVEDTGIGIAPEDVPRLFRKFEQLDAGTAKTHQGTGLGLALTRRLVELHDGTITAQSPGRGHGSTFTVRLPLGPRRERPAVLVVDDDPTVRSLLLEALSEWGWDGAGAETLAGARAALERATPDLVILDAGLPDGSGVDFVREVRGGAAPRFPILMYTGLGAQEGLEAREAGADDYLVKPAPLELIRQKACDLLARAGWRDGAGNTIREETSNVER